MNKNKLSNAELMRIWRKEKKAQGWMQIYYWVPKELGELIKKTVRQYKTEHTDLYKRF